jgi:hypothetical protein
MQACLQRMVYKLIYFIIKTMTENDSQSPFYKVFSQILKRFISNPNSILIYASKTIWLI